MASCYAQCSPVCLTVQACGSFVGASAQMLTRGAYTTVAGWVNAYRNQFYYSSIGTSISGKAYASQWNDLANATNGAVYYTASGSVVYGPYGTSIASASTGVKISDRPASSIGSAINQRQCVTVTTGYCADVCGCEAVCGAECGAVCPCQAVCGTECGIDSVCPTDGYP